MLGDKTPNEQRWSLYELMASFKGYISDDWVTLLVRIRKPKANLHLAYSLKEKRMADSNDFKRLKNHELGPEIMAAIEEIYGEEENA